jgi:hypothetical protein
MPDAIDLQRETKICESCGDEFGCGANLDGCWCAEVTLSTQAATNLKTKFSNCRNRGRRAVHLWLIFFRGALRQIVADELSLHAVAPAAAVIAGDHRV